MMLLWHDRMHDDPAQRWLREVIVEVVGAVAPKRHGRSKAPLGRPASRPAR